jgi:hypothetical protein
MPAVMQESTRRKASRRAASRSARGRPPDTHKAWSWADSSASSPRGLGRGAGAPGWRTEAWGCPERPRGGWADGLGGSTIFVCSWVGAALARASAASAPMGGAGFRFLSLSRLERGAERRARARRRCLRWRLHRSRGRGVGATLGGTSETGGLRARRSALAATTPTRTPAARARQAKHGATSRASRKRVARVCRVALRLRELTELMCRFRGRVKVIVLWLVSSRRNASWSCWGTRERHAHGIGRLGVTGVGLGRRRTMTPRRRRRRPSVRRARTALAVDRVAPLFIPRCHPHQHTNAN